MTAQPEARLQRRIQSALKLEFGAHIFMFKVWGSEHMMVGLPDLIGCVKGRFFGLEVKMPKQGSNTTVKQKYVLDLIAKAGGVASVVCSPTEAIQTLRAAVE